MPWTPSLCDGKDHAPGDQCTVVWPLEEGYRALLRFFEDRLHGGPQVNFSLRFLALPVLFSWAIADRLPQTNPAVTDSPAVKRDPTPPVRARTLAEAADVAGIIAAQRHGSRSVANTINPIPASYVASRQL
jgi:hypothetical protein